MSAISRIPHSMTVGKKSFTPTILAPTPSVAADEVLLPWEAEWRLRALEKESLITQESLSLNIIPTQPDARSFEDGSIGGYTAAPGSYVSVENTTLQAHLGTHSLQFNILIGTGQVQLWQWIDLPSSIQGQQIYLSSYVFAATTARQVRNYMVFQNTVGQNTTIYGDQTTEVVGSWVRSSMSYIVPTTAVRVQIAAIQIISPAANEIHYVDNIILTASPTQTINNLQSSVNNLTTEIANLTTQVAALHGIPAGGLTDQILSKASNTDYDVTWRDQTPLPPFGGGDNALAVTASPVGWVQGPVFDASQLADGFDLRIKHTWASSSGGRIPMLGTAPASSVFNWLGGGTSNGSLAIYTASGTVSTLAIPYASLGSPSAGTWMTLRFLFTSATSPLEVFMSSDNGETWDSITTITFTPPITINPLTTQNLQLGGTTTFVAAATFAGQMAWFDLRDLNSNPLAQCDLSYQWEGSTWTDRMNNEWSLQGTGTSWVTV